MRVKNLHGTANKGCKCGSWLTHWRRGTSNWEDIECSEKDCCAEATDGAHVTIENYIYRGHYIIPLCHLHNEQEESLVLKPGTKPISANKLKTCEK